MPRHIHKINWEESLHIFKAIQSSQWKQLNWAFKLTLLNVITILIIMVVIYLALDFSRIPPPNGDNSGLNDICHLYLHII